LCMFTRPFVCDPSAFCTKNREASAFLAAGCYAFRKSFRGCLYTEEAGLRNEAMWTSDRLMGFMLVGCWLVDDYRIID
jgi:hypothetical protein